LPEKNSLITDFFCGEVATEKSEIIKSCASNDDGDVSK
jgi:hypothetical protein